MATQIKLNSRVVVHNGEEICAHGEVVNFIVLGNTPDAIHAVVYMDTESQGFLGHNNPVLEKMYIAHAIVHLSNLDLE